jgi:hypothetical protein
MPNWNSNKSKLNTLFIGKKIIYFVKTKNLHFVKIIENILKIIVDFFEVYLKIKLCLIQNIGLIENAK